jgi:4-amino-4-deoxy-L-arabinose transferase-like glycosyltransferase
MPARTDTSAGSSSAPGTILGLQRSSWRLLLVGYVVAAGAALRFWLLGAPGIWFDEALTATYALRPARELVPYLVSNEIHPPIYYLLVGWWLELAGLTPASLRFVSAAAGTLTLPVVYSFARELYGSRAGLIAALLTATSVYHVMYSQEARSYALLTLLLVVSWWLLYRTLADGPTRRTVAAYTATLLAASYINLIAGVYVAAQVAAVAVAAARSADRVLAWRLGVAYVVLAVAGLAWVVPTLQLSSILSGAGANAVRLGYSSGVLWAFWNRFAYGYTWGLLAMAVVLGGLAVSVPRGVDGVATWRDGDGPWWPRPDVDWRDVLVMWAVLGPLVVVFAVSEAWVDLFRYRYALPVVVCGYLLAARGVDRIPKRAVQVVVVGLLVTSAAGGYSDYYLFDDRTPADRAFSVVADEAGPGAVVVVPEVYVAPAKMYLGDRFSGRVFADRPPDDVDGPVWLVRPGWFDMDAVPPGYHRTYERAFVPSLDYRSNRGGANSMEVTRHVPEGTTDTPASG